MPPTINPNKQWQETVMQPAASAPPTPMPQLQTPAAPIPSQPLVQTTVGTSPTTPTSPAAALNASDGTKPLLMPSSGSVVDLLNMAGQDSSYQARQQLAQQYGIQGYTGAAAQNIDLSKKYLDFYNARKATLTPDTGSQYRQQSQQYFEENKLIQVEDSQKEFFDNYASMNPVVKSMYDTIQNELSTPMTTTSFKDEFAKLQQEQGIPALNTELMNIKNIMDGTEDDIRSEITRSGGFATDSQVMALTGARNKTLLKQANVLQQQLALKTDYVNQIMAFSTADRAQVEKEVGRKLGLTEKLATIQETMTRAAHDNYQKIVDTLGYQGLADAIGGDKKIQNIVEQSLQLPKGALSNPNFLAIKKPTTSMTASIQEYEYAKSQGYKGSFSQYQNEDANRKIAIAKTGAGGLTPNQINSSVNQIAGAFDNEPIVKSYNTVQEGYQTIKSIGVNTTSPADDIAFIYAFAKIMDPNSVVREGEYNTIQKYAQTWADNFGFKTQRIYSNTNFLSADAKQKMLNALGSKVQTITGQYKNLQSEYQRQMNDAYLGKPRQITNYSRGTTSTGGIAPGTEVTKGGVTYVVGADGESVTQKTGAINWNAVTMKK